MKRYLLIVCALALCSVLTLFTSPDASSAKGSKTAVNVALAQVGDSYSYGATGPSSFDCSGLVKYSFQHAGYSNVPRTAQGQYDRSRKISRSSMRRGDLLFYHTRSGHVYHVAIYLGHGRVVEAANPHAGVRTGGAWKAARWAGRMR